MEENDISDKKILVIVQISSLNPNPKRNIVFFTSIPAILNNL